MSKNMTTDHYAQAAILAHNDQIELLTLLRTLWRGASFIALCTLCAVIIATWYVFFAAAPMYESSAQMSLQVKTESVIDINAVLSGATPDQASINTEMEIIKSRGLLADLVDELDLINDPEFNPTLRGPSLLAQLRSVVKNHLNMPILEDALSDAEVRNIVINQLRGALSIVPQDKSYIFTIGATTQDR
jgi:succinoglycan biosynthesis transport protein ExoP